MAKNKISMKYNLRQNNVKDSSANGKWYAFAVTDNTLTLRGLANHIAEHGSLYTIDVVLGVLTKLSSCIVELAQIGTRVKLDGLGTFYITLESEGADTPVGYNLAENLKGAHLRFLPDNAAENRLTSRVMTQRIGFRQNMIIDKDGKHKMVVDGELVDYNAKVAANGVPDDPQP